MINVLYLIDNLVLAGAQKQLLQTLKYIDSTKYKKYVIYFDDCNGQIKEFSKYTDEILYIKRRFRWDISIIWKLLKFIHKEKITIVHSHLFMSTFFGVIASKIAGVPIVNQYIHNVTEPAKYRYVIMKLLFPLSDAILCSSRAGRDFFFSKINSKITVINNMISLDIGLLNQKTNIIQTHKLEHYEHFIGKVANFNK